ncbi:MAG TPA: SGNH/GDSL hydrolase family protein [Ramlibacter sp.]|jgi:phospholipase/lecithinase/hemolysin|nr:SGNH/GDSL hydrolase family protein [Ramlibacter sp.]
MASQWLRRAWLLAACASALALAACGGGGGDIVSKLSPKRVVTFGDAMADLGQNGGRYTVNDGSVNNWTAFVASSYGLSVAPSTAGGTAYAYGNARVVAKPDAAGNTATPTVQEQIDAFLATGRPQESDLLIVSAGTSDVIVQAQAALAGTQTRDQMLAAVGQAGRDLAAQVRRLVSAGARQVVVSGPYNLGRSPWAVNLGQQSLLEAASSRFNDQLLIAMVDLGANVLYVDAALQYNLYTGNPGSYGLTNVTTPVCTSLDPGPGIGTGSGQFNSRLCTTSTLAAGSTYSQYLFADRVYPTPRGHQLFGDYAQSRIRERF